MPFHGPRRNCRACVRHPRIWHGCRPIHYGWIGFYPSRDDLPDHLYGPLQPRVRGHWRSYPNYVDRRLILHVMPSHGLRQNFPGFLNEVVEPSLSSFMTAWNINPAKHERSGQAAVVITTDVILASCFAVYVTIRHSTSPITRTDRGVCTRKTATRLIPERVLPGTTMPCPGHGTLR